MASIAKILVFLVIFQSITSKPTEISRKLFKHQSKLNGHSNYFKQNFTDYPTHNPRGAKIIMENIYQFMFIPKDEIIKFLSVETRPHLFVERDGDGFYIWGPFYSVVQEAANYINYSVDGINIFREDRNAAFVKFKPHFLLCLLWPQLEYTRVLFDKDPFGLASFGVDKLGKMTRVLGVVDIDHVIYFIRPPAKAETFAFLETFDWEIWAAIFLGAQLVTLVLTDPANPSTFFGRQGAVVFRAIFTFTSDHRVIRHRLIPAQRALLMLWLTGTMLLQYIFGGDMFEKLVKDPKEVVIDNLDDLMAEPGITIRITDTQMIDEQSVQTKKSPLNPDSKYYGPLSARLDYIDFQEVTDMKAIAIATFGDDVINSPKTWNCLMGLKDYLNYMKNSLDGGRYRDILHVSQEGAATQVYAFAELMIADSKEKFAMDYVSLHLTESGIFQKWMDVAIYGIVKVEEKAYQVSYRPGRITNFLGPLYICCGTLFISLFCYFTECLVFELKEKRIEPLKTIVVNGRTHVTGINS